MSGKTCARYTYTTFITIKLDRVFKEPTNAKLERAYYYIQECMDKVNKIDCSNYY